MSYKNDTNLSWAAKGVLAYMTARPAGYKLTVSDLIEQTAGSRKKSGRDACYVIINELIDKGYLSRIQLRNGGAMDGTGYQLAEGIDQ